MAKPNESKEVNEQNQQNKQEENLIDLKGTLRQFVVADEPELSQEEAIMKFGENKKKKKNSDTDTNDADDFMTEEEEHLKRIKQELLASLKRVEQLEELLFKSRSERLKLNVKDSKGGGFTSSKSIDEEEKKQTKKRGQKERE